MLILYEAFEDLHVKAEEKLKKLETKDHDTKGYKFWKFIGFVVGIC